MKFKCLVSDRMKRTYWNSKSWSHEANEESHSLHVFRISKRTIINSRMLGFGGFSFRKHYWKKAWFRSGTWTWVCNIPDECLNTYDWQFCSLAPPPIPLPGLGCLALFCSHCSWKTVKGLGFVPVQNHFFFEISKSSAGWENYFLPSSNADIMGSFPCFMLMSTCKRNRDS